MYVRLTVYDRGMLAVKYVSSDGIEIMLKSWLFFES